MNRSTTREQIVEAADLLFYQQGFEHTSFTDIASMVHISRGNFYHHFKSKDEILDAVIDRRLKATRALLQQWEQQAETAAQRIVSYINILLTNRTQITLYGCPVGTLCNELAKLDHWQHHRAIEIFTLFKEWLAAQFRLIGERHLAEHRAMEVLAWSQGVATMFNAFHDETFVRREVKSMCDWVNSLQ